MTVAEARKAMSDETFTKIRDEDGTTMIAVGGNDYVSLILDTANDNQNAPIIESEEIKSIEVRSSRYKTLAEVHIRMLLRDAEKKYGKVELITLSAPNEFVEFSNQPKRLTFTAAIQGENKSVGNYKTDERGTILRETKSYNADSYISGIKIYAPVEDD